MTLENVFRQWTQSIQTDPDTGTRSIATDRDGAKIPLSRGYIQCVLTGTTDVEATYPFKVQFVSADGTTYPIDMSTDDRSTNASVTESSAPGGMVPANSTLLKYVVSGDWEIGSATVFASEQTAGNLYW